MKAALLLIVTVLSVSGQTCADKNSDLYDRSFAKWKKDSISSYYLKVNYRAFTPQQGVWELEVKEGQVVRASFNGKWDAGYVRPAERFTVDSLFNTAREARSVGNSGAMVMSAEYSETVPYIKSVGRNAGSASGVNVKKDAGFSITILEFRQD